MNRITNGLGLDREATLILPAKRPDDLAARVTRCAQSVHATLGPGLDALFYVRALAVQLRASAIAFEKDCWVEVRYREVSLGKRRADFLLDDLALAVAAGRVETADLLRLRSILLGTGRNVGLLMNFAADPLEIRRVDARARPAPV